MAPCKKDGEDTHRNLDSLKEHLYYINPTILSKSVTYGKPLKSRNVNYINRYPFLNNNDKTITKRQSEQK